MAGVRAAAAADDPERGKHRPQLVVRRPEQAEVALVQLLGGVELGSENVRRAQVPWASIHEATPGVLGLPGAAPYHRILVSAMARELPDDLVAQLHSGGVMVIPVGGTMLRVSCSLRGTGITRHGSYRFVPLR